MFGDKVFLVVDDFQSMRNVISAQLRSLGVDHIVPARDGAEALALLRQRHIDLVLSDWNMPHMSGLELLQALRADPRLARLPFIMVTSEAQRERIVEAITAGVSSFLVKPYTTERLAAQVRHALAGARAAQPGGAPKAAPAQPAPPPWCRA